MNISSPAFKNDGQIPSEYTCDGTNKVPPLVFEAVPAEAKSLALIIEDPDAPSGTFDHLVSFNIPPKTEGIKEVDTAPPGTFGTNSAGQLAYMGPCPPEGEHRYVFKLFALDTQLALKKGVKKEELLADMEGHTLAKAEMTGRYARKAA